MLVLGLTGSIGTGKSTTAGLFRAFGIPVYDADASVHALYAGAAVEPIAAQFPQAIVNGKVDRVALKKALLQNPGSFAVLEQIIHPLVQQMEQQVREKVAKEGHRLLVLDIPLLFEKGAQARCDLILLTIVDKGEQRRRVLSRPNMQEHEFDSLLARQMPQEEKRLQAHFVIDTGLGIQTANYEVQALIRALTGMVRRRPIHVQSVK